MPPVVEGYMQLLRGPGRRLVWFKWLLCLGMLAEMSLCPRLWTNARSFPCVPIWDGLPALPDWLCSVMTASLVLSILLVALCPNPGWWVLSPAIFGFALAAFDIDRLQPWAYEFYWMFLALALVDWRKPDAKRTKAAWGAVCVILIGIYFWSGTQKVNMLFATQVFPYLLQPLGVWAGRLHMVWPVAPVVETGTGLLLLFSRTRKAGVLVAALMHSFNLAMLGPWGDNYNSTVWPWNLFSALMAAVLLWGSAEPVLSSAWSKGLGRVVTLLFAVMPALNYADRWDGFLSASFYSGRLRDGWIYLTPNGSAGLPIAAKANPAWFSSDDVTHLDRLNITMWAMTELNIPPYAEPWAYKALARQLVKGGVPADGMALVVLDRKSPLDGERTFSKVPIW